MDVAGLEIKFGKPLAYKKQEIAWITKEEEFGAGGKERSRGEKIEAKGMAGWVLFCNSPGSDKDLSNITYFGVKGFLVETGNEVELCIWG